MVMMMVMVMMMAMVMIIVVSRAARSPNRPPQLIQPRQHLEDGGDGLGKVVVRMVVMLCKASTHGVHPDNQNRKD